MYTLCQGMALSFSGWQPIREETEVWLLVNSDDEAIHTYARQAADWSLNLHR